MALRVNTNISSLNAQRNLAVTSRSLDSTFRHLSSGLRITSAADDAAGLAVSENLRKNIASLRVAARNSNDGISVTEQAEGGMAQIGSLLSRMRELAVQASSGTLANTERNHLNTEFAALSAEIERISEQTNFNGVALTNGSTTQLAVQVGINNVAAVDRITIDLFNLGATALAVDTALSMNVATDVAAQDALGGLDLAIGSVNSMRASVGAIQNRLNAALNQLEISVETNSAAESRIRDADFATETAALARQQVLSQSGVAVLSQANTGPQLALQLL
jgi:flagellin